MTPDKSVYVNPQYMEFDATDVDQWLAFINRASGDNRSCAIALLAQLTMYEVCNDERAMHDIVIAMTFKTAMEMYAIQKVSNNVT